MSDVLESKPEGIRRLFGEESLEMKELCHGAIIAMVDLVNRHDKHVEEKKIPEYIVNACCMVIASMVIKFLPEDKHEKLCETIAQNITSLVTMNG